MVDTAGIRDTTEDVERLGVEVSHRYLAKADIVLYCIDATTEETADWLDLVRNLDKPYLVVRTKTDLLGQEDQLESRPGSVNVSALTGAGLSELREELVGSMFTVLGSTMGDDPIVTRARHRVALETALAEVGEFASTRAAGIETAVAATHLRAAVSALESLVGLVTPEDVLDRVFSNFCVGK